MGLGTKSIRRWMRLFSLPEKMVFKVEVQPNKIRRKRSLDPRTVTAGPDAVRRQLRALPLADSNAVELAIREVAFVETALH